MEFGAPGQRVLGTSMGDTSPNHKSDSYYRNPTFYHMGTLDPLGRGFSDFGVWVWGLSGRQGSAVDRDQCWG